MGMSSFVSVIRAAFVKQTQVKQVVLTEFPKDFFRPRVIRVIELEKTLKELHFISSEYFMNAILYLPVDWTFQGKRIGQEPADAVPHNAC